MFSRIVEVADSSNVAKVSYEPSDYSMKVEFTNGDEYEYEDVEQIDFGTLVSADSVGSTFSTMRILRNWPSKKIL